MKREERGRRAGKRRQGMIKKLRIDIKRRKLTEKLVLEARF